MLVDGGLGVEMLIIGHRKNLVLFKGVVVEVS
jgi:hypothetical protein